MKYKGIIFDMDGTIIDTEHIWIQTTQKLVEGYGKQYTQELKTTFDRELHGLAMRESCTIIKNTLGLECEVDDMMRTKSGIAKALYAQEVKFIQGFLDFHTKVVSHNLKYGIATNADDVTLQVTNQALNLPALFGQHIYNISHVNGVCKPSPDLYLHAAKQLGLNPVECIAIEDSAHGVRAAKAAGMLCIGINTAKKPHMIKEADLIIDEYHEIDLHGLLELKK
jgi:beta-phosphoglucomutase